MMMLMKGVTRFLLLAIAYLVFAGQMSVDECIAAAVSASLLVSLLLFARFWRTLPLSVVPAVALRLVLAAAPKLLTDSFSVAVRMLSGDWQSGVMSQEFVADAGAPQDVSWWAVFTLTTSVPPDSYLITRLARPGLVVMHRLAEPSAQ
jgi:hypothetical protein